MLWYCSFTWYPGMKRAQVAQRVVQEHDASATHPELTGIIEQQSLLERSPLSALCHRSL
jgi:hypothetical protein